MWFRDVAAYGASGFTPRLTIVGTGPAGLSLALKLAEHRIPCLLIEAGGLDFSDASQAHYRGTVAGDSYFQLHTCRLRQFGGSSGHWSGWCRTLDTLDFEPRPGVPDSGWPIRKADLEPYAARARELLQISTPDPDRPATPELDEIDIALSPPVRFGTTYRAQVEQSPAIGLLLNTAVRELVPGEGRIESLVLVDAAGGEQRLPADIVCLCTGGIENSRLLLWSNRRHGGRVVPQAAALGRYWMEHPSFRVGFAALTERAAQRFEKRRFFAPSAAARTAHASGGAHLWIDLHDRQSGASALMHEAMCSAPGLFERLMKSIGRELRCGATVKMEWEQFPVADNRIELGREADAFGMPRVVLHWRKRETERRTARIALQLLGEALIRQDAGRVRMRDFLLAQDEPYPIGDQGGAWHHMGGTRMADSPERGIVDRHCKVFGMANLYIGGSSVFATGGHANPTHSIVQLALRLGDHLHSIVRRA